MAVLLTYAINSLLISAKLRIILGNNPNHTILQLFLLPHERVKRCIGLFSAAWTPGRERVNIILKLPVNLVICVGICPHEISLAYTPTTFRPFHRKGVLVCNGPDLRHIKLDSRAKICSGERVSDCLPAGLTLTARVFMRNNGVFAIVSTCSDICRALCAAENRLHLLSGLRVKDMYGLHLMCPDLALRLEDVLREFPAVVVPGMSKVLKMKAIHNLRHSLLPRRNVVPGKSVAKLFNFRWQYTKVLSVCFNPRSHSRLP